MARRDTLRKDPWNDLVVRKGNRQVGLEDVVEDLSLGKQQIRELKKALVKRVVQLTRDR